MWFQKIMNFQCIEKLPTRIMETQNRYFEMEIYYLNEPYTVALS